VKSVVQLEIQVPQAKVAALFADPGQSAQWMDDIRAMEPISGEPGMPGSRYRLVPKKGDREFVATVLDRELPTQLRLNLNARDVQIFVKGRFVAVTPECTRLTHEQICRFRGPLHKALGFLARPAIRRAQRRHMESFKRFAEARR
jgi:hypothetical protein